MISALKTSNSTALAHPDAWSEEMLLIDGKEYFPALLFALSQARAKIAIETYIFECDSLAQELIHSLNAAHRRGVKVCLLVDGVGSSAWISDSFQAHEKIEFEVRVYHPLPWQIIPSLGQPKGPGVQWLFRLFSYANSRNHRKCVLIDDEIAFVGSLNISDAHLSSVYGERAWHDVGVRLQGTACEVLENAFESAWQKAWSVGETKVLKPNLLVPSSREKKHHPLVVRNDGRLLRHKAMASRLRMIHSAREKVWIANAYFVPSGPLQRALVGAARRGVDVRLLLPAISDVNFMPWVARAFYASLIQHGVRLFEYQPRILHAKVMYIDDRVTVGSSNLNHRSLLHDSELDVILQDAATIDRVRRMFETDFLDAIEVERNARVSLPLWKEMVVRCLLYFRHIL